MTMTRLPGRQERGVREVERERERGKVRSKVRVRVRHGGHRFGLGQSQG